MMGKVTILHYNDNADCMISSGGRISTMDGTAGQIYEKSLSAGKEKNERLIEKVMSSGHTSVLEHGSVNLAFENVSVLAEQFLIEFRLGSFTVKSRRYVDFANAGYYRPEMETEAGQRFDAQVRTLFDVYEKLCQAGVPKEDARFVLPYCFCSNFFCTVNCRELIHIMNELVYGRGAAVTELRELGESLFSQCEAVMPYLAVRRPEAYRQEALPIPEEKRRLRREAAGVLAGPDDPVKMICDAAQIGRGMAPKALSEEEQDALLRALLRSPRKRELEQVSFTLLFGGLSLSALTHLTRHRMQSLVAPELLRCADYDDYVLPQTVVEAKMEQPYREAFRSTAETVQALREAGAKDEILSYLLLSGQRVPVLTTVNAGELYTFFRLRTCTRAQWEIREAAEQMLFCLRQRYPRLFSLYGPTCFMTGKCPEGKMCCGKTAQIREKFSELQSQTAAK